ncbi:MAG: biotin carboxylase N-terminal domain-containing protein, partial [Myxococcota bacterium]
RVAIVNRGEPAVRLQHAVRELRAETGVELATIALYTEPDAHSMFVREADDRYLLGPATFVDPGDGQRKSKYLDYEALERALRDTRADAAWVGWGFVAEHPRFADLCERLGIIFIGPSGDVMRRLGDKIASKQLAESAGVPVAPWSGGPVETLEDARQHASRLGYPLMIKATAGGGGRGIRSVRDDASLAEAFESARSEALKAFGDATVFLEKRVEGARHVEVQVLADTHGNTWAVGVRDCTIQRRNQKVLEEAPSPALDAELDAQLRASAVRLAKAAGYRNAGTVECLIDPESRRFFFMEMNTRLQVEHPVTEATTGIDLVKLQLQVASGYRLEGEPPATVGHAVEVRLNAEDPDNQFAPAPGLIDLFRLPTGPGVRVDTGVRQGDTVAPEFDSMIAKIIAYGRNRTEAVGRLKRALFDCAVVIRSGASNKAFLLELLDHPDVVAGDYDIAWLDRTWATQGTRLRPLAHIALMRAAIDVYEEALGLTQAMFMASAARGRPTVDAEVGQSVELRCSGQSYSLFVQRLGSSHYRVCIDDSCADVRLDRQGPFETWITCAGRRHRVVSVRDGLRHLIEVDGIPHRVSRDEGGVVRAPSPAVTLAIHCKVGDEVRQGDRLMVLEAMKMEMGVVAPCSGRVREVTVLQNMQVNPGAPLVIIEPAAESVHASDAPRASFPTDLRHDPKSRPREVCHQLLTELRQAVQGFDITDEELRNNAEQRSQVCALLPPDDETMWRLENDVLRTFADITWLFRRELEPRSDKVLGAQEMLRTYLRAVEGAGKGLPADFLAGIERALAHYGVESLDRTQKLEEALIFLHKSQRRARPVAEQVFRVLERKLQFADELLDFATPEFREILDRLIEATMGRDLALYDLAREVRYQFFDRPFFESARAEIYERVKKDFATVCEVGNNGASDAMRSLIACPQPLMGFFTSTLKDGDAAARDLALTIMLRRLYRIRDIRDVEIRRIGARSVAVAPYEHRGRRCCVVATYAGCRDLQDALSTAFSVAQSLEGVDDVTIDLFTASEDHPVDLGRSPGRIRAALEQAGVTSPVSQVVVSAAHPAHWRTIHYFTFDAADDGYVEHEVHRGIHPMLAERLELWRLRNFKTRQLRARDDIYLFHAVARDNPKDERLFAFVEVRDLTAVRDASGQVVQLPHLERVYTEALAGIRDFQSRRSARQRLHWNRVVLYVWPEAGLSLRDVAKVSKQLAPLAKGLGLEKAVVRIRLPEAEPERTRDAVIHISNRVGTGMHLRIDELSDQPIRPLSAYAQKVVRMRKMGLVYPYEVIRMLTPAKGTEEAEFPHGTFQEYDLDDAGVLMPVNRAPGENKANVVVGVVTNFTAKHPEGMSRVIVLGDASREMAALAEPECRRIIKAIELAEEMRVPAAGRDAQPRGV